eukprot:12249309-Prorocentrum_lima.AAC.1
MHHQPPHLEPELPGARVAPGQVPHYDLGDEPTWSWPPGLAQGPGGSLQRGFPRGQDMLGEFLALER